MYVDPKPLSSYPWYVRPLFTRLRRRYGQIPEPARLWGRMPKVFAALSLLGGALERRTSAIEPPLRDLVAARVAQVNRCAFSVDLHSHALHERGVPWEKIGAIGDWRSSEQFSNRERVVLDYAEAMTRTDAPVSADIVGAVKRHLDDEALIELTGLIAFQNMTTKFNNALDVPPQGFCSLATNSEGEAVASARDDR